MIRAQAWPEILGFLESVDGQGAFCGFLRRIAESPKAAGLHAYTSHLTVAIARTREIQDGQERLMVCYEPRHGRVHMAFTDWGTWDAAGPRPTIRGKDSWVRDYAPEEAFPAFLKLLRRVGWVPDAERS